MQLAEFSERLGATNPSAYEKPGSNPLLATVDRWASAAGCRLVIGLAPQSAAGRFNTVSPAGSGFGPLLAGCRRQVGLNQSDVAARMGVNRAAVSALELPGSNPTVKSLRRWAEALQVRVTFTFVHVETGTQVDWACGAGPGDTTNEAGVRAEWLGGVTVPSLDQDFDTLCVVFSGGEPAGNAAADAAGRMLLVAQRIATDGADWPRRTVLRQALLYLMVGACLPADLEKITPWLAVAPPTRPVADPMVLLPSLMRRVPGFIAHHTAPLPPAAAGQAARLVRRQEQRSRARFKAAVASAERVAPGFTDWITAGMPPVAHAVTAAIEAPPAPPPPPPGSTPDTPAPATEGTPMTDSPTPGSRPRKQPVRAAR